jgi:hypothetical protein
VAGAIAAAGDDEVVGGCDTVAAYPVKAGPQSIAVDTMTRRTA